MSRWKKIVLFLLLVFIGIQFIRPARNISGQAVPADITKLYSVPAHVQAILKTSCYDCHSNNTQYPWYANVQPAGWLLAKHVKDGKAALNFNEFGNYTQRRQLNKLRSIASQVKDGEMPLQSYTWIHQDAKLSAAGKTLIIDWVTRTRDSLEAN